MRGISLCEHVCVCFSVKKEGEKKKEKKANSLWACVWSMTLMEYLGSGPFTAESPGKSKVHQGVIYSSVAALRAQGEEWLRSFTYVCTPIRWVWTSFYACVLLYDAVGKKRWRIYPGLPHRSVSGSLLSPALTPQLHSIGALSELAGDAGGEDMSIIKQPPYLHYRGTTWWELRENVFGLNDT